jgi:hypothetical protein
MFNRSHDLEFNIYATLIIILLYIYLYRLYINVNQNSYSQMTTDLSPDDIYFRTVPYLFIKNKTL